MIDTMLCKLLRLQRLRGFRMHIRIGFIIDIRVVITINYLHFCSLPALFTFNLKKRYVLTLTKVFKSFNLNRPVVDKHVFALGVEDKSVSFLCVKPLNGSLLSIAH